MPAQHCSLSDIYCINVLVTAMNNYIGLTIPLLARYISVHYKKVAFKNESEQTIDNLDNFKNKCPLHKSGKGFCTITASYCGSVSNTTL